MCVAPYLFFSLFKHVVRLMFYLFFFYSQPLISLNKVAARRETKINNCLRKPFNLSVVEPNLLPYFFFNYTQHNIKILIFPTFFLLFYPFYHLSFTPLTPLLHYSLDPGSNRTSNSLMQHNFINKNMQERHIKGVTSPSSTHLNVNLDR